MNLKEKYQKKAVPELKKRFGFKSDLASPRIIKVAVNVGLGTKYDPAQKDIIKKHLALITGQKPADKKARKSIASFKVRKGAAIGLAVILRGKRMYDFLDKLVNVALPRMRDFRGINLKSVDKSGNLTVGFKEQTIFPEVIQETDRLNFGLEISIHTSAKTREQALELFKVLGFPFAKVR